MKHTEIVYLHAREIIDSRGNPTVSCRVVLADGSVGEASVPSGASTGRFEAFEKRDGNPNRFFGKGVLSAVQNVNEILYPALRGKPADDQFAIDQAMITLDQTENKSNFGANAILSVSLACARASAMSYHMELYQYIGGKSAFTMPVPMMNILNGGAHAGNNIDIQEFMILPLGAESMKDSITIGAEIYATLKAILKEKGKSTAVGDEGGFAPDLESAEEALNLICEAIERSGYHTDKVGLALDVAASEWMQADGLYHLPKSGSVYTADELTDMLEKLVSAFPIVSLEDPLGEEDFQGWQHITKRMGNDVMLVGDDLFVTNSHRLQQGIISRCANSILIKPNQIGTVSEVMDVITLARDNGYGHILSHRSGETEDVSIADLAVATHAGFIKTGAPCRSERVAKYNRLMAIEEMLGSVARYGIEG